MSQLRAEDLSERQRQILDGLVDGKSNGILAEQLGITVDGVKWHVSQMLWDTGCTDRYQLADWWERERGPRRRGAFFGLPGRPSRDALAGPMRLAGTLAMTAVLVVAIYAGWTCSGRTAPATVTPASALGKIAYVQDGDLYVKQLPEGTPQRITHITQADRDANAGFSAPTWSHSGDWLSARRGKEFAVLRADGNNPRFYDAPPVWSPVDDRVAVIEGTTIFVEDADGTNRIPVAQPARVESPPVYVDVTYSDLTWSTDGAQLAYVEHHIRAGLSGFSIPRTYEGIRAVATGGRPTSSEELYNTGSPPTDGLGIFMWAPQTLVFFRYPSFSADIAADGVALEALKPGMATPFQPHYFGSPDPVALLDPSLVSSTPGNVHTAITRGAGRETWTSKRIALLVWQTGVTVDVTETSVAAISPAISQDGQRIAYSAMPDTPGLSGGDAATTALMQRKIWVMSPASAIDAQYSTKQQLTTDPAYRDEYPQWSADGSQILFVRMDAQGHASLWLMDADGSNEHKVLGRFDLPAAAAADPAEPGLGYYGTISWQQSLAWYRPSVKRGSAGTPWAAASPVETPVRCATPSALDRIDTAGDALRLSFVFGFSTASLIDTRSVERVRSAAPPAVAMFIKPPATSPFGPCLSAESDTWVFVAHGTFVIVTPPVDEGRTYHTFWAIAFKGTDEVLSGFDPPSADLSQLGSITSIPASAWQQFDRQPHTSTSGG